jgi:hypothetical protein
MKKFIFNVKEVSIGIVEVFAENEEKARELAENYEGNLLIKNSNLIVGEVIDNTNQ